MIPIQNRAAGVSLAVKVHPRAKRNELTGTIGDAIKLSLTAPPLDGRANQACIEFLAEVLDVPRSSVSVVSGHTSQRKIIRIAGCSAEEISTKLELALSDR
jgi:uncharacterized protein